MKTTSPASACASPCRALEVTPAQNAVNEFLHVSLEELSKLRERLPAGAFQRLADFISRAEARGGRLHFTGIGKSEYVAGYAAALFASTGTPAYFLHGTECVHGSAGQVVPGDVVLVVSNSGETREMQAAVLTLKRNGALLAGVSGNPHSWLAGKCDEFLYAGVEREGSPLDFEPRASVLAQIYVLAALSIELQARKQITRAHYNAWHPGGVIGERLGEL